MNRTPALLTYYCDNPHCRALVAMLAPGAVLYDTRLQCPQCSTTVLIIKRLDNSRSKAYHTEQQPA